MTDLIANLDRDRFTPYCIVPEQGELSDALQNLNCTCFYFRRPSFKPKNIVSLWRVVKRIRNILRKHSIHIVHTDFERDAILFGFASKPLATKAIWHCRVAGSNKHDSMAVAYSDAVIAISDGVKQRIVNTNKSVDTHVIYNGVDTNVFTPKSADSISPYSQIDAAREDKPVVLFVGQLKRGKGIFELLTCAKRLPQLLFVFVGSYLSKREELEFSSDIDGAHNVVIVPQQEDIVPWMQHAKVLVLPSHEGVEGMGRVLFEAMSCGVPVIGTDTSGVREVPTDACGLLVPHSSPEELASAISAIVNLEPLEYDAKSSAARERAVNTFDSKLHAGNVMNLYQAVLPHD